MISMMNNEVGDSMKVICIFNQKGGVGKTTTNINLCSYLAMNGHRVLTIDIDPQGNTTSGLGLDKRKIHASMYDVLTSNVSLKDIIQKSEIIDNFYIAPSNMNLAAAEVEILNNEEKQQVLKSKISEIKDEYDYVFIDCPPSLGILTINALTASDSVLIPIQCEFYALEGVGQLMSTIQLIKKHLNTSLYIEGVIISMYDGRTKLCNEVVDEIKAYFDSKVYKTYIPRNVKLAESPSFGLPIMLYDDKCRGSEAFEALAEEFIKRQEA